MPDPINYDETPCALCDCYGLQHDDPEHGGPCRALDGHGRPCGCPGFEEPEDAT
ncbi:hypothetical protein SEA_FRANKIE_80 [Mycobacterium phage Frankie]|nr:hypothetical protein SEA_FRANKIE_80 [Mycobacterium phage Frankie]